MKTYRRSYAYLERNAQNIYRSKNCFCRESWTTHFMSSKFFSPKYLGFWDNQKGSYTYISELAYWIPSTDLPNIRDFGNFLFAITNEGSPQFLFIGLHVNELQRSACLAYSTLKMDAVRSPKRRYTSTGIHGVRSQRTVILRRMFSFIFTSLFPKLNIYD